MMINTWLDAIIGVLAFINGGAYTAAAVGGIIHREALGPRYRHVVYSSISIATVFFCITARHILIGPSGFGPAGPVTYAFIPALVFSLITVWLRIRDMFVNLEEDI